jgi:HEAT repeat protein
MPDSQNVQVVIAQLAAPEWESRFLASKFLAGDPGKILYESLSAAGQRRVATALVKRLDDDESRVRAQAAAALGRLECASAREPLLTALADPNEWVRVQVGEALARIGDQTLAPVVAQHLQTENEPHVRATLVKALGSIGDEKMLPVLALFLDDVDGRVRANCVESLAQLKISKASRRAAILKLENDPSNRVQANVAISSSPWVKREGAKF